jgi:hypothetical protein
MRFSDYLAALPPAAQTALTNDLTVGCGRVTLALRLLESESPPSSVINSLTAAYYDLHISSLTLGLAAPRRTDATRWEVPRTHLPPGWGDDLATLTPAVLITRLAATNALVHALGTAITADDELAVLQTLLSDLLRVLVTLPDPVYPTS